jgi:PAS domain S-box-containing protein
VKVKINLVVALLFITISIISIGAVSYVIYSNSEKIIFQEAYERLISVSEAKARHVQTFVQEQKITTDSIAIAQVFKDLLKLDKGDPAYAERLQKVKNRLNNTIQSNPNYYINFILDKNGIVVASSNPSDEGSSKADDEYFIMGKKAVHLKDLYIPNTTELPSISISAPVFDDKKELLGVYVAILKTSLINDIVSGGEDIGEESVENFLINKEGYVITPLKYVKDSVLKLKVSTTNTKECLQDIQKYKETQDEIWLTGMHVYGIYQDYRGVNVLGTHSHISPQADWCLITKVDESEELGVPRKEIINLIIWICSITTAFILISSYFVSKIITNPLKKLTENVNEITKGKLEIQLEPSKIKEIHTLITSLNRILISMKIAILKTGMKKEDIGLGEAITAKQEAEEKYKALYESSSDAIMMIEPPEWKFTAGNPSTIKIYGLKDEKELKTLGPWDLSPKYQPDGRLSSEKAKEMIMKAMKEGSSFFEWTHKKYKGEEFRSTVLLSKVKIDGKEVLQATVRDLTEKSPKKK